MKNAQILSGIVFVIFIASSLILFVKVKPEMNTDAIIIIGAIVTPFLPYLILAAALGSQLSAAINAVSSRSDLLIEATYGKIGRKYTYLILVIPCIVISLFSDVTQAISYASRVFAAYFALQCLLAIRLAYRKKQFKQIIAFSVIGIIMVIISIFGISV